jgi:SAM-dependent methyltransferase
MVVVEVVMETHEEPRKDAAVPEEFGKAYWEERYSGSTTVWSGRPNAQLVAEATDLAPGTALDAGCGEGGDAIWLAGRGWQVTAVDISGAAVRRGQEHAATHEEQVAKRIEWIEADLTAWQPGEGRYDLVATHFLHLPGARDGLFGRLAEAVAPGGTLLVVGHDLSDPRAAAAHHQAEGRQFTAEEVAADLDPDGWDISFAGARTREATDHEGNEIIASDTVLCARRRP